MNKFYILFFILFALVSNSFANQDLQEQVKEQIERTSKLKQMAFAFAPKTTIQSGLKSASASTKMLAKISYPDGSYKTFAYNDARLLIDYKSYLYDDWDKKMELLEHQEIEYDKNGNETLYIDRYNDTFDGFIIKEKREASYNENNIPKEEITWEYDDTDKALIKIGKSVYTLTDASNLKIEDYSWNAEIDDWKLSGKTELNFSDFEHPNTMSTYHWNNSTGEFQLQEVLEFTYNDKGQEIELIENTVSEETGELTKGLTITTTYNSDGNILSAIASGMFMGENIIAYENIYTYENGLMVTEEYNSVFGSTKTEYSYTNGKLSEKREFYPDYDENWVNLGLTLQYKDQFVYDNNINVDNLAYPSTLDEYSSAYADFCNPFYFQYGALESTICFSWDYSTEDVIEDYRGSYHYSDFKAGIQEETAVNQISETNLEVGPNPCTESLNINIPDAQSLMVSIYNTNGQIVYKSSLQGQNCINTLTWRKGIYMISTETSKGNRQTMKLIKK